MDVPVSRSPDVSTRPGRAWGGVAGRRGRWLRAGIRLMAVVPAAAAEVDFHRQVQPVLESLCYDCHADGAKKGGVVMDEYATEDARRADRAQWWKVLRNVRSRLMPPADKPQPDDGQRRIIDQWIKADVLQIDPTRPDPGRVVPRRLNRVEYRNTIRDLTGIDFNTEAEFPPDDAGHGFDNIADVLTVPPMLLEKYLAAADVIVHQAVPTGAVAEGGDRPPSRTFYDGLFPPPVPDEAAARRAYAARGLRAFASRAFRRPVDDATVDRLTALAEAFASQPGRTFAGGIAQAMTAVLASPRFLFREEAVAPEVNDGGHPLIDEYSLASRLSYFLWVTMPDDELLRLAGEGKLRSSLAVQVQRLLADPMSARFVRNFTGQWLRARDIEGVNINARVVLAAEGPPDPEAEFRRQRFRELRNKPDGELTGEEKKEMAEMRAAFARQSNTPLRIDLTGEVRRAMRAETERTFDYILRDDRRLLELIESDYTFVNETLARFYGIEGVTGDDIRRVALPAGSPRGGILTQGTVLAVTSNPTRTSPVKRGLFILDTLLGAPPPPPPPNVPALEDSFRGRRREVPTLRETLALHREQPLCHSCHNRMDPLGLALENFNAMGLWRDQERGKPVDATGQLLTGESFKDVRDLKHLLATLHRDDFYRTLTEKLLTYALGRGLEYYDVGTVDAIVDRLIANEGRASVLLSGIIDSAPFQRTRRSGPPGPGPGQADDGKKSKGD